MYATSWQMVYIKVPESADCTYIHIHVLGLYETAL